MTLEDKVHATRLLALQRAEELGNVSAACRELGISRSLFYRWKNRYERYGRDGLHPKRQTTLKGRPHNLSIQDEQAILALALSYPTCGPRFYAEQLARQRRHLSPSTIYRALRRVGLGTRSQRLVVLEQHSAQSAGLLTERTRRELQRARRQRRHVQASEPGELVCLDTFYIGRLKGVGKVWQITACDAACSYAAARIIPANTAEHAVRFLVDILLPLYEAAGWPLQRVLTDRGSEFKSDFDTACHNLSIRHTRTKPRHAWTNGFVERLQGTILHQHWRVAFRRRYFTTRSQLDRSLQRYLAFYNDERAHQGYRTKGRTPSTLFWGAADNILNGGD
jgi:transposase|tara:strand:+ start:154 stop:1161 length:1008 start_codon:yes stop_codon:yes gene_type:complete